MDKTDYLHKLKTIELRPGKVQVKEFNPTILNEVPYDDEKENILDISREEKVHVGESKTLLEEIDTDHEKAEEEGEEEVKDLLRI